MSYIALAVALGGTAYALESGSVTSRHIKDGQVRPPDLGLVKVVEFPGPYSIPYSGSPASHTEAFSVKVPEPGSLAIYARAEIAKNYSTPAICNLGITLPGASGQPLMQLAPDTDNNYDAMATAPGSRAQGYAGTSYIADGGWLVIEADTGKLEGSITMGRVFDTNCQFRNVELHLMPLT